MTTPAADNAETAIAALEQAAAQVHASRQQLAHDEAAYASAKDAAGTAADAAAAELAKRISALTSAVEGGQAAAGEGSYEIGSGGPVPSAKTEEAQPTVPTPMPWADTIVPPGALGSVTLGV